MVANISLQEAEDDRLVWRLAENGEFSVKTAYSLLCAGRTKCAIGKIIWKSKAPAKCKFFMFLAVRGACLTADNLQRRGWHLCTKAGETCAHLFLQCQFTQQVWDAVRRRIGLSCTTPSSDLSSWWCSARR